MSLQVKFPFGRGHGPLHTCGSCGFATRHRVLFDNHLRRCTAAIQQQHMRRQQQQQQQQQVQDEQEEEEEEEGEEEDNQALAATSSLPAPPVCRNYRCDKCGYATSKSRIYLHHQRDVHGVNINVYPCDLCEYASKHKSKVLRHRKLVHKDVPEVQDIPNEEEQNSMGRSHLVGEGDTSWLTEYETSLVDDDDDTAAMQTGDAEGATRHGHQAGIISKNVSLVADENQNESIAVKVTPGQYRIYEGTEEQDCGDDLSKEVQGGPGAGENGSLYGDRGFNPQPTDNPYNYVVRCTSADGTSPAFKCKLCRYTHNNKWKIAGHVRGIHMKQTLFKCPDCEFVTERKIEWCVHKTTHANKSVFACKECSYRTTMRRNFERHLVKHQLNAPFRCSLCSYSSTGESAIQRHMAEYHPSPSKQMAIDSIHSSKHSTPLSNGTERRSPSPVMSMSSRRSSSDSLAVAVPGSPGSVGDVQCRVCGLTVKSESKLKIHMVAHSTRATWTCPVCPLKYKRAADLNRHMKRKHARKLKDFHEDASPEGASSGDDDQDQPLDLCTKKEIEFEIQEEEEEDDEEKAGDEDDDEEEEVDQDQPLDLSMKPNGQAQGAYVTENLKCNYCSYLAKWPSDLRRHMLVHSVEKRFRCQVCSKKYKYQFDLNMHMRKMHRMPLGRTRVGSVVHSSASKSSSSGRSHGNQTGPATASSSAAAAAAAATASSKADQQSKYVRQLKRTQTKESQKAIENYFTGDIPDQLKCPYCPYIGKYRAEVERHTRLHTGAKPFHCLFCVYKSYWKGDMKRHLQKHHVSEVEIYGCDLNEMVNRTFQGGTEELKAFDSLSAGDGGGQAEDVPAASNRGGSVSPSALSDEPLLSAEGAYEDSVQNLEGMYRNLAASSDSRKSPEKKICACPRCSFVCEAPSKLKCHMEIHDNLKRFMCPHCGKRSNWLWDVRKHIRKDHPDAALEVTELEEEQARNTLEEYLLKHRSPSKVSPYREIPSASGEDGSHDQDSNLMDEEEGRYADLEEYEGASDQEYMERSRSKMDGGGTPSVDDKMAPVDSKENLYDHYDYGLAISELDAAQREDDMQENMPPPPPLSHYSFMDWNTFAASDSPSMVSSRSLAYPMPTANNLIATVAAGRYRRFKCSVCGRRSNWKWDLKKHIRANHVNAEVIEMSEEDAKLTFHEVLESSKPAPSSQSAAHKPPGVVVVKKEATPEKKSPTGNGGAPSRYRPFKCSECGRRSNWKWDMNKHIRSVHPDASLVILDDDEAKATFEVECCASQQHEKSTHGADKHSPGASSAAAGSQLIAGLNVDIQRVKRFQCSCCRYRSNYRSDMVRHLRRKHRRSNPKVVVLGAEEAATSLADYLIWAKSKNMLSPGRKRKSTCLEEAEGREERPEKKPSLTNVNANTEGSTSGEWAEMAGSPPKMWRCSMCNFKDRNKKVVLGHYKTHSKGTAYMCNICGDTSDYRGSIYRHVKSRHGRTDFSEVIIKTALKSQEEGVVEDESPQPGEGAPVASPEPQPHSSVAYIVKAFQCKLCPSSSLYRFNTVRHIKDRHPEMLSRANEIIEEIEKLSTRAPPPGKASKRKAGLVQGGAVRRRRLGGDSMKALECNVCPYRTNKQGLLKLHKSYHRAQPGNKFKCQYCPYFVCANRLLAQHMRLHMKEDPSKTSSISGELEAAVVDVPKKTVVPATAGSKSPAKGKYFCDKCPYVSVNKNDYIYHKQFHRPKPTSPFKCDFCPYWVSQRRLLTQHKKVHSKDYKTLYYPQQPAKTEPQAALVVSPSKSVASSFSEASGCDVLELAHTKQRIIASKITSVPITPEKLKPDHTKNGELGTMKGYVINKGGQVISESTYRKLHKCSYCPYTNVRAKNLRLHTKMHRRDSLEEGKELHKCPHCDYSVGNRGLLSHHIKVHSIQYTPGDNISDADEEDAQSEANVAEARETDSDDKHQESTHDVKDQTEQPKEAVSSSSKTASKPAPASEQLDARKLPKKSEFYIKYDDDTDQHILERAVLKKWCCERCPYATMKRSQFEKHLVLHGSKQRYTCEYCDYSVPGYHLLLQHKRLHMMPNPNLLCVQTISNLQKLPDIPADIAVASMDGSKSDTKDPCLKLGVHDNVKLHENSADFNDPRKLYRCDRCPYTNSRRDHLLSHLKFHMISSDLKCSYCDYSVSKMHLLNQHIKVHFNSPGSEMSAFTKDSDESSDEVPKVKNREGSSDRKDAGSDSATDQQDTNSTSSETEHSMNNPDTKVKSQQKTKADDKDEDEDEEENAITSDVGKDVDVDSNANDLEHSKNVCVDDNLDEDDHGVKMEVDESEDAVSGQCNVKATSKVTAKVTAKVTSKVNSKDTMWICQYCDRAFEASEKLLRHEMQHLVGNKY